MSNLVKVKLRLKNANLANSMRMLAQRTNKLPSVIVNRAAMSIAIKAKNTMPVTLPTQIDTALNASVTPMLSTRGPRKGLPLKSGKVKINSFGRVGKGAHPNVPLAVLIINAQVRSGSNFNNITGHIFQRFASPFKGVTRKRGGARMLAAMKRLLSSRRQSSGYYRLCAHVVQEMFRAALGKTAPVIGPRSEPGFEALPGTGKVSRNIGKLAGGTPAYGSGISARASFWVTATESDSKGARGGLDRVARPVWQAAVDAEAISTRAYAETLFSETARSCGLTVK